ncbi:hypothetical protein M9M90_06885 [Phenylobacterium sp. LH3H17]|uniref:hypothetical protein n=1 Tax=Phenylobacterium sp. LH3H17 TaxID=2903901 RepID=UPI0020C93F4C|nr:hypothetical protein [Phenylobacterium sp. LH3H17]UTP40900.1 hypothetical protein M9M90_06885 [Phenylobacterium sp. LH3H17]
MAKYIFDITDGKIVVDISGLDLPDINAVTSHAIGLSSAPPQLQQPAFWRGEEWPIEAKDIGVVLYTLAFRASDKPVVRQEARVTV